MSWSRKKARMEARMKELVAHHKEMRKLLDQCRGRLWAWNRVPSPSSRLEELEAKLDERCSRLSRRINALQRVIDGEAGAGLFVVDRGSTGLSVLGHEPSHAVGVEPLVPIWQNWDPLDLELRKEPRQKDIPSATLCERETPRQIGGALGVGVEVEVEV